MKTSRGLTIFPRSPAQCDRSSENARTAAARGIASGSQTESVPRRARSAGDVATAPPAMHLAGVLTGVDPAVAGARHRTAHPVGRGPPEAQNTPTGRILRRAARAPAPGARGHSLRLRRVPLRIAVVVVRGARDAAAVNRLAAKPAACSACTLTARPCRAPSLGCSPGDSSCTCSCTRSRCTKGCP